MSTKELTPETSDMAAVYMAIVAPDDPLAVLDLVALIPASSDSTKPTTFTRKPGKWEKDERVLADLNSPTPPPIVVLDDQSLTQVLEQIDGAEAVAAAAYSWVEPVDCRLTAIYSSSTGDLVAVAAAGGLDRNRGKAEQLRRYWLYGRGAAKIRWNTPGDWTRCFRQLSKYLGPRAKGYCALRHKEATGMWTGDKRHRQMHGKRGGKYFSTADFLIDSDSYMARSVLAARHKEAVQKFTANLVATGKIEIQPTEPGSFKIPLVIPEGVESGDGRIFEQGAIEMRELPLPLLWQIKTGEGHAGSVVVGRIDQMERVENGIGNAVGVFDTGPYGAEAERLVRSGFIRGVSADLDQFEAKEEKKEKDDSEEASQDLGGGKITINKARVMAVTLVSKPAFQECRIYLDEQAETEQESQVSIPDGVYAEEMDPMEASALVACGLIAGSIPVVPPATWFFDQNLSKPTPLTVTDEGQVFGHIAAWHVDHIGMSYGTKPPKSKSKYAYFHTGVVRTDDNNDVAVGQLTLAGGHASLSATAAEAAKHYDDTASAVADVHAGEDAFGIWVAGAVRPGTTPEQIRALRASAPSGDWRPIKGGLELVAVCQVNVPGFPIARARVASGQVMALVAAGAGVLARLKSDPVTELAQRIEKLEQLEKQPLLAASAAATERMAAARAERNERLRIRAAELALRVDGEETAWDDNMNELGFISRRVRKKLAAEKKAMPDGSFPIRNVQDLKNAISSYGLAKDSRKAAVKRHIMRRARGLDRPDLIPEKWKSNSVELAAETEDLRVRAAGIAAAAENMPPMVYEGGKYTPQTQPRDEMGKFRDVLARLKADLGESGNQGVVEEIKEADRLAQAGDYNEAAKAAGKLINVVERIDTGALNSKALENVREGARQLGEVLANLPLPFGNETMKLKYSELPPALRDLVKEMIDRVVDKIGREDAKEAIAGLESFMSGGDLLTQSEVSSEMSKLLRLLT